MSPERLSIPNPKVAGTKQHTFYSQSQYICDKTCSEQLHSSPLEPKNLEMWHAKTIENIRDSCKLRSNSIANFCQFPSDQHQQAPHDDTRSTLPQVPSASLLEFSILASGTSRTPFDEFQITVAGAGVVAAARTTSSKQRRVLCNAQHPSQLAPFVAEHQDGAVQGAVCRPGHVPSLQI